MGKFPNSDKELDPGKVIETLKQHVRLIHKLQSQITTLKDEVYSLKKAANTANTKKTYSQVTKTPTEVAKTLKNNTIRLDLLTREVNRHPSSKMVEQGWIEITLNPKAADQFSTITQESIAKKLHSQLHTYIDHQKIDGFSSFKRG